MKDKILLVVDMQNDFIDGSLGTKEAENIVNNVIKEIKNKKEQGYKILATQDTHQKNYLNTQEGKNLPIKHCIEGTEGWEIAEPIKELIDSNNIFKKNTFGSKDLYEYLKENEPEEVEILGLCTDICVISNALLIKALYPEKEIFLKENCCAGVTPELHNEAIDVMKSCQIQVI